MHDKRANREVRLAAREGVLQWSVLEPFGSRLEAGDRILCLKG